MSIKIKNTKSTLLAEVVEKSIEFHDGELKDYKIDDVLSNMMNSNG